MTKKILSGFLIFVGFLLSPLCWWNDLIINLPIAYLCGELGKIIAEDLGVWFTIAGYWLTNVAGMILMQIGSQGLVTQNNHENYRTDLVKSVGLSSVYTGIFLLLSQAHIFDGFPLLSFLSK
jgi:hypothetical protein